MWVQTYMALSPICILYIYINVVRIDSHTIFLHALAKLSLRGKRVFEKKSYSFRYDNACSFEIWGWTKLKSSDKFQVLLYFNFIFFENSNKYFERILRNNIYSLIGRGKQYATLLPATFIRIVCSLNWRIPGQIRLLPISYFVFFGIETNSTLKIKIQYIQYIDFRV